MLQFPGNNQAEEQNPEQKAELSQVFFLLLRRNAVFSIINEGINIFGQQQKQVNIIELFISSEYSLTNYTTIQAVLNYVEDRYKPTKEKLGRESIPNDLHDTIVKATTLYYMLCKNSGFYKIAIEESPENTENEIRTKIMTPMATYLCDALSQAMQTTKAIGTLLSPYDAVAKAILLSSGIESLQDDDSKNMVAFADTIKTEILTPTMGQILDEDVWLEKVSHQTISKLIFKTCIFSYVSISINDMLKDIVNKHLPMGVFLNALMMSSHAISTLAIEEKTSDENSDFIDSIVNILHTSCFAICMIFENAKDKDKHPAHKYIPSAFDGIVSTYNIMIQQVNKSVEENSKKLELNIEAEKLLEISEEDITTSKELINKLIEEDIKTNQEDKVASV